MDTAAELAVLTCEVVVPDPAAPPQSAVSRWSDSGFSAPPAAVVVPDSEQDIVDAIRYAQDKGLCLLAAGGGHGSFAPIGAKTLYLDLKKVNTVTVDATAPSVTVGGGAKTGQVVQACTDAGFLTTWPNNNAVGFTGFVLGGGNSMLAGLYGMAVDNVLSFRVVTTAGEIKNVSAASEGDELDLFEALCGAGHGLGVVVSTTLRVFPLPILGLTDGMVWSRRLVFPGTAIDVAAAAFIRLQRPSPALSPVLVFARASGPSAATPMIMLTASFFGPAADAPTAAAPLFDDAVVSRATQAATTTAPLARMNDAFAMYSSHGDYKDIASARLRLLGPTALEAAFARWDAFTDAHQDAQRTAVIFGSNSTAVQVGLELESHGQIRSRFFDSRDRPVNALAMTWCSAPATVAACDAFILDFKTICRQDQPATDSPRTIVNNMRLDSSLEEMQSQERIAELKQIKKRWDSGNLLWSPYA